MPANGTCDEPEKLPSGVARVKAPLTKEPADVMSLVLASIYPAVTPQCQLAPVPPPLSIEKSWPT